MREEENKLLKIPEGKNLLELRSELDKSEDEKPKTFIQVLPEKKQYQILFPNILRVQKETEYFVDIDWKKTEKLTVADVYIIPIRNLDKCLAIAKKLRKNEIKTDIDLMERGLR